MIITDKKEVKRIMKSIAAEIYPTCEKWQNEMIEDIFVVAILADGRFYTIQKPSIKTHFCFDYGYCGMSTREEREEARKRENHAATDENYFKQQNLECFQDTINDLTDYLNGDFLKIVVPMTHHQIIDIRFIKTSWDDPTGEDLSKEDAKTILAAYQEAKKLFEKRLDVYLKRFGLSKLKTWTYLSD